MSLAVINGDHDQKLRGVARWEGDIADDASLHEMMGKGYLVITIEPQKGERYQGVVGLEGETHWLTLLKATSRTQNSSRRDYGFELVNSKAKFTLPA